MQRIKAAVLLVLMLMCAALFYGAFATPAFAAHSTSVNVAVVPSFESSGSGDLDPDDFPGYQFTAVDPGSVAQANDLAAYDTVILFQFCDVASHTTFTSALVAWMQTYNGKIIIWDSDSCTTQYHNLPDYSWLEALGATFQTMSAGQTGSQSGTATVV